MDLLERYLKEVSRHLPRKDRDDILAELRSLLTESLQDRVEGTPTDDDMAELLKEFGSPQEVAARYFPEGQYLIGPELFPFFRMVAIIVIAVVASAIIFSSALSWMFSPDLLTSDGLTQIFLLPLVIIQGGVSALGSIVIVFYILQRTDIVWEASDDIPKWEPTDLPAVNDPGRIQRVELFIGIAFNLVWLIILNYFRQIGGIPVVIQPAAADPNTVIPVASYLLVSLIGLSLVQLIVDMYVLQHGRWQILTRAVRGLLDVVGVWFGYQVFVQVAVGLSDLFDFFPTVSADHHPLIRAFFIFVMVVTIIDNLVKTIKLATYSAPNTGVKRVVIHEG